MQSPAKYDQENRYYDSEGGLDDAKRYAGEYTAKLTNKKLVGKVACELSSRTHGATDWWVLVEKKGAGAGSKAEQPVDATGATRCLGMGQGQGQARARGRA